MLNVFGIVSRLTFLYIKYIQLECHWNDLPVKTSRQKKTCLFLSLANFNNL